jgi:hypothetical protein
MNMDYLGSVSAFTDPDGVTTNGSLQGGYDQKGGFWSTSASPFGYRRSATSILRRCP